jgi:hypothetical protein
MLWFESSRPSQPVRSRGGFFPVEEERLSSRRLGRRAPVSARKIRVFACAHARFRVAVSARYISISVSAARRPVRLSMEIGFGSGARRRRALLRRQNFASSERFFRRVIRAPSDAGMASRRCSHESVDRRQSRRYDASPMLRSCSAQEYGRPWRPVTVRSRGAVPSMIAAMTRGDRKSEGRQ